MQSSLDLAPGENVVKLDGQAVHSSGPSSALKVPTGHDVHSSCSSGSGYIPAGQLAAIKQRKELCFLIYQSWHFNNSYQKITVLARYITLESTDFDTNCKQGWKSVIASFIQICKFLMSYCNDKKRLRTDSNEVCLALSVWEQLGPVFGEFHLIFIHHIL